MARHPHLQHHDGIDRDNEFSTLGASAAVRIMVVAVLLIAFWFSVVWALAD